MTPALHVVKAGSSTLAHPGVFAEVAARAARGARILLVAGGARGIAEHYEAMGRPMPMLRLRNGDEVRHCSPEEMQHVVDAYERVTLPRVETRLTELGLGVFATTAARGGLVRGKRNRPLRVVRDGRDRLVRDHRAGSVTSIERERLRALLGVYDVVCLSPPVRDADDEGWLNVDADVLAAELSNALAADHLRLVTSTPGLLEDSGDDRTTVRDAFAGEPLPCARGRMRQKVRAAQIALAGSADVAITGPDTLDRAAGYTRFWRAREPAADVTLLSRAVQIPSVSYDERELALFLVDWCERRGIDAGIDPAGNFVARRGEGMHRLLMLGHLDTVPFHWPASWTGNRISGRGSVDAKGSLVAFVETLAEADVPAGVELRVVGAVEEEVSSSKGAYYVRDHYPADAVIVGEPSGHDALTLGYHGLLKLRLSASVASGHSAASDAVSAADVVIRGLADVREAVLKEAHAALSAVVDVRLGAEPGAEHASAVINFRVPPGVEVDALVEVAQERRGACALDVLRATPGVQFSRATQLARAFTRAFARVGLRPRFVVKKGTSDMNTLATSWRDVPMVAYGPGDSTLDHTDIEHLDADAFRCARRVLSSAVASWIVLRGASS